jgi:DNA-binding MarR family transcriptional regulator
VSAEFLSWNPREYISAFRRWHHGQFSLIHLNVLTMLEADGPDSMSHLAEALDVSVASMTGIVDRMEKRGLVERRHEGNDRRVVLVYPTDAGRDVFREIDERRRIALGKLLEQLTVEELEGLLKGHVALRKRRAELTAARLAESDQATAQAAIQAPPSRLHGQSTIAGKDRDVEPITGARR